MMNTDLLNTPILQNMLTRRSIRQYRPDRVPHELITALLTAAIWAPSGHNRQPWRFTVIETPERIEHLARAMGSRLRADLEADGIPEADIIRDTERSYRRITSAPVLILLSLTMGDMDTYPDSRRSQNEHIMAVQSVALAAQNLMLAAHDAGLGTCWMCAPLFAPDTVREALELPNDWRPQGLITLGYPDETPQKTRKGLEECVLWR